MVVYLHQQTERCLRLSVLSTAQRVDLVCFFKHYIEIHGTTALYLLFLMVIVTSNVSSTGV